MDSTLVEMRHAFQPLVLPGQRLVMIAIKAGKSCLIAFLTLQWASQQRLCHEGQACMLRQAW